MHFDDNKQPNRNTFDYGGVIDKSELAFTQPTNDGVRFFRNYMRPYALLTYKKY